MSTKIKATILIILKHNNTKSNHKNDHNKNDNKNL